MRLLGIALLILDAVVVAVGVFLIGVVMTYFGKALLHFFPGLSGVSPLAAGFLTTTAAAIVLFLTWLFGGKNL